MTAAETILSAGQLRQAFRVFDEASRCLSASYVDLSEQVERLTAELERSRRLAATGEVAARLAHQLRTPLAAALLYVSQLENAELPAGAQRRFAAKAAARLRDLERLVRDMLLFVKGENGPREPLAVAELLGDARQVMAPLMAQRGVGFAVVDAAPGAQIEGCRKSLAGALLNLLDNALRASRGGGAVELAAHSAVGCVVLAVRDEGCGIAREVQERLFEPFFTTRADGHGLGLAHVRSVMLAHGGAVAVRSTPGAGAEFTLTLPALAAHPAVPAMRAVRRRRRAA